MDNVCENCGKDNPKKGMKTCCRKCADALKSKRNREVRICLECKSGFEVRKSNPKKICSKECREKWTSRPEVIEKRMSKLKEVVKDKYGVDNIFQLEDIKLKSKKTKLDKYGDENYCNREQQYKTTLERHGENFFKELNLKSVEKFKKEHGVEHPLQLPEFLEKQKQTNLERYGETNVSKVKEFKEKRTQTIIEKFGVENASQNKSIKQKKKETSLKNFGVEHHLKDYDMLQKHFKAMHKIEKYKKTDLYYQGSYELLFLKLMDKKGLLDHVSNGRSYEYLYKNKTRTYHTDFVYKGVDIEIKSGWTYNKNGKDLVLQEINDTKWKCVRDKGGKIEVLIDKQAVRNFVSLIKT